MKTQMVPSKDNNIIVSDGQHRPVISARQPLTKLTHPIIPQFCTKMQKSHDILLTALVDS